ncbi:MAG TPA: hypothetical protein VG710_14550 [Opitutus sp.]|nr:hypothetical protein [Opitutus sp.]
MQAIRAAFTVFFLAILAFALLGWHWTASLPPDKMAGAHCVLGLAAAAALTAVVLVWKAKAAGTH